ncbi:MAG: ACT domain-containing protein, partial [Pseudomonadota bacterium]
QGQLSLAEVMPVLAPSLVGVQRGHDVVERFEVQADNRDGLLNDITQLIIGMQLGLVGTTGKVSEDARQAFLTLELRVGAWTETLQLVSHLRTLQAVTQVQVFHDSRN